MSGRIRSIKPEILEDEKTAGLSHEAWRLFVSMWILADDFGALRAEPAWLHGQVFWSSPAPGGANGIDDALEELNATRLVQIYEVRGQRYAQITNWGKHQKVDHPGKPRVPRISDEIAWPVRPRATDLIYFIQADTSRAIKIGISWNPARRLASLQVGHHEPLSIIASGPGDLALERSIHREFADSRLSGEWFKETPQLLAKAKEVSMRECSREDSRVSSREVSRASPTDLAPDLRPPTSDLRPSDLEQTLAAGADSLPPKLLTSGDPEPKQPRQRERRQPKTRLQADWVPTEQHRTRALELGLSVAAQATKFRDYHEAKGSVFANWDAAFRNWLSNAREFADARGEPMPKKPKLVVVDSDEEPPIPTSQWGGT